MGKFFESFVVILTRYKFWKGFESGEFVSKYDKLFFQGLSITDTATFALSGATTVSTLLISLILLEMLFFDRIVNKRAFSNNFDNSEGTQRIRKRMKGLNRSGNFSTFSAKRSHNCICPVP